MERRRDRGAHDGAKRINDITTYNDDGNKYETVFSRCQRLAAAGLTEVPGSIVVPVQRLPQLRHLAARWCAAHEAGRPAQAEQDAQETLAALLAWLDVEARRRPVIGTVLDEERDLGAAIMLERIQALLAGGPIPPAG